MLVADDLKDSFGLASGTLGPASIAAAVQAHSSSYGWETALRRTDSVIVLDAQLENNAPASIFMHCMPSLRDSHWHGDCSSSQAYSFHSALNLGGEPELQSFKLAVLDGRHSLDHHRVILRASPDEIIPLEYSRFFGTLDWSRGTTESKSVPVADRERIQPNTQLDFSKGYYYKEFPHGDSFIVMTVSVRLLRSDETSRYRFDFELFEQKAGTVTSHSDFYVEFPANYAQAKVLPALTGPKLLPHISKVRAEVTRLGRAEKTEAFLNPVEAAEISEAVSVLFSAIVRGQDPDVIAGLQRSVIEPMRRDPFNWWK